MGSPDAPNANAAMPTISEFLSTVQANPVNRLLLKRLPQLELRDAWLVAAVCFRPCGM